MVITLDPALQSALDGLARAQGVPPETLAVQVLRERLLAATLPQPRDEWERELLAAARPWGVSLPDAALSSEASYD
jgi:hypothetical protein